MRPAENTMAKYCEILWLAVLCRFPTGDLDNQFGLQNLTAQCATVQYQFIHTCTKTMSDGVTVTITNLQR